MNERNLFKVQSGNDTAYVVAADLNEAERKWQDWMKASGFDAGIWKDNPPKPKGVKYLAGPENLILD